MTNLKIRKYITYSVAAILALFFANLVFVASTLLFTIVCNYASIDKTTLAGFPLYFSVAEILAYGFYKMREHFARRNLSFHRRHYVGVLMALSICGIISSIIVGTYVYGSFLDYRIVKNYPLLMLIINVILFAISTFVFIKMNKDIKNKNLVNDYKMDARHVFKTIGYAIIAWYAFDRLGAFILMPIYYSSYDSYATIPYLIQLLVPLTIAVVAFINKRFLDSRKFAIISFSIILAYSVFSLLFLVLASRNISNLIINSISLIQHFERLITIPIDLIIMYLISILVPVGYIIHAIFVMPNKLKKKGERK